MEAYYYHKEIMEQRGLSTKDLPENLKKYVIKFNQKKRFTKDTEKIRELQEFSQILGEKIAETEIKRKSTIKDITSDLENETVEVFKKGGQIDSIEQIQEDENAVAEVSDDIEQDEERKAESVKATTDPVSIESETLEENVQENLEKPKQEVIKKVSEIEKEKISESKEEEENDWGMLNFLKW